MRLPPTPPLRRRVLLHLPLPMDCSIGRTWTCHVPDSSRTPPGERTTPGDGLLHPCDALPKVGTRTPADATPVRSATSAEGPLLHLPLPMDCSTGRTWTCHAPDSPCTPPGERTATGDGLLHPCDALPKVGTRTPADATPVHSAPLAEGAAAPAAPDGLLHRGTRTCCAPDSSCTPPGERTAPGDGLLRPCAALPKVGTRTPADAAACRPAPGSGLYHYATIRHGVIFIQPNARRHPNAYPDQGGCRACRHPTHRPAAGSTQERIGMDSRARCEAASGRTPWKRTLRVGTAPLSAARPRRTLLPARGAGSGAA